MAGREEYREIALQILGAACTIQYRYDGRKVLTLRAFHGHEAK